MYLRKVDGPRAVTLPDGRVMTRADLPPPDTRRWVASRNAAVVRAVEAGLISRGTALETYGLSEEADLRKRSQDGYLLSGLSFNKYGDRSNAIGKRFGRLKDASGFGPELVFHSIRKTVATKLENAGVSEGVAADILGHKKKTMTYGLYSGGTSIEKKAEALAKLAYDLPAKVMTAA